MFRIQLTDFRCFADSPQVELLPVTFLVGENSAGKTSFLAATRMLLEILNRSPLNPFNTDPYQLGGFDQLAHYRGGVRGRATQFSFRIVIPASPEGAPTSRRLSATTAHKFTFIKGAHQPALSEYVFSSENDSVVLTLREKITVLSLVRDGKELAQFKPKRMPPTALLRRDLSYLRFVFDELQFGSEPDITGGPEEEVAKVIAQVITRFKESNKFLTRRVFASAPVRTQPLRTYTPSEVVPSAEGAHVPLEMARQKISSPSDWESVHAKLAEFGKNSGLFDDIDIRLLGKRDGEDPFQVMVRTGGPPMNLVDVGYGVSQALPIIYQLEQTRLHDTFLLQQPEVHLHPRAQAALGTLVARLSRTRSSALYVLETHSDYIIDRVRTEVAAGRLDSSSVTIIFFDRKKHEVRPQNIYLSPSGDILDPPDNFRTFFLEEQQRLLGL